MLAGDVDQDGDVDLVADLFLAPGMGVALLRNDGTGRFTDVTQGSLPPMAERFGARALTDVNGDGRLDLLGQRAVLLGDGRGKFALAPGFLPDWGDYTAAVAVADFDNDGRVDLFLGNQRTPSRVALNPTGNGFVSLRQDAIPGIPPLPAELLALVEDLDGDADLDLIVSPLRPNPSPTAHVFLGDGRLGFRAPTPPLPPAAPGLGLAVVGAFDADGDRRPDLVTASATSFGLWRNLGAGRFVDESTRLPSNAIGFASREQALAIDAERDGDLDLVVSNLWNAWLWLNDGRGRFTDATAGRMPPGASSDLLAGDLDADGDTDLLGRAIVLLNDGKGSFAVKAGALPSAHYWRFLGDLDGDGQADAIADGALFLGDGTGRFFDRTAGHLPPLIGTVLAVADVDLDGDFDLFGSGRLFLNDGHAVFFDATDRRLGPFVPGFWPFVVADFDQDGDVDYLCNNGRIFAIVNRHTQTELPFLPRTGRPLRFECFVRPGYDSATPLVLPLLSAATARLPLPPFGTLLVDPLHLVTLPPATTKSYTGSARWTFSLPPDPSLTGSELAAQAFILPDPRSPSTWQLGNGTTDTIWP